MIPHLLFDPVTRITLGCFKTWVPSALPHHRFDIVYAARLSDWIEDCTAHATTGLYCTDRTDEHEFNVGSMQAYHIKPSMLISSNHTPMSVSLEQTRLISTTELSSWFYFCF
jgi:hypothetical protein